jgi:hypothetical protein
MFSYGRWAVPSWPLLLFLSASTALVLVLVLVLNRRVWPEDAGGC